MKNRIISLCIMAALLLTMVPYGAFPVSAAQIVDSGWCGDNVQWKLDSDGTLTIFGSGPMEDCTIPVELIEPWVDKRSSITTVQIENSVTSIGDRAFAECASLTSVTIPDSVTSIGYGAFGNCGSLTSVTIPDSVTSIGGWAFENCKSLTSVTIPDSVTSIGDHAFYNCDSLTSVTIPDSVTLICDDAFSNCKKLEHVIIGSGLSTFGDSDYGHCRGFENCPNLKGITFLGNAPEFEGDDAFGETTVTCYYRAGDKSWDKHIGNNYGGTVTWVPCETLHDFTKVVTPPSGDEPGYTTYTCACGYSYVGNEGSGYCGENVEWILSDDGTLTIFGSGPMEDYPDPPIDTSVKAPWFDVRNSITAIQIENSVTSIGDGAFYDCDSLTSVTIPDSVTFIGDQTFALCQSLTSVSIPDSVTSIGDGAFFGCGSLTSVTIPDSVTSIGDWAFESCDSLTSVMIPDSVTSIGDYAFYSCINLTSVTIPDSVTSIGGGAFFGCGSLMSVTIPDSVTSIGHDAFWGCDGLTSVTIPDSVTSIGNLAFSGCDGLTNVTIPDSVISIGGHAFNCCDSLNGITFLGNAPEFEGDGVFNGTTISCYYRAGDETWEKHIGNNYGGTVTWVPCETLHDFTKVVTPPSGDEPGYTTYTCACGYSYVKTGEEALDKEPFNEAMFRADELLLEGYGHNLENYLKLINDGSFCQLFNGTGELQSMNALWSNITVGLDTIVNGDAGVEYHFEQRHLYETILLNALEAATDTENANSWAFTTAKKITEESKNTLSRIKESIKLESNWEMVGNEKVVGMSPEKKEAFKEKLLKEAEKSELLGKVEYFEKSAKILDQMLEFDRTVEEAIQLYYSYANLWSMSDSLADVLDEMYAQAPDDEAFNHMRNALQSCSRMIRKSNEEQFAEGALLSAMNNTFGEKLITKGISKVWDEVMGLASKASPEVAILLFAYDASRAVGNLIGAADAISEQSFKVVAIDEYYSVLNPTIEALAEQYKQNRNEENAEALLSAVLLMFGFADEDCDTAYGFADAVDDALLYKIKVALDEEVDWFLGTDNMSNAERVKKQTEKSRKYFLKQKEEFGKIWIPSLQEKYPEIYPQYSELIGINPEKPLVVKITNSYEIACPVDVFVYDSEGNLVVDLSQDTYYFGDGIKALRIGDKKYIDVSDESQYTIRCVGYDEGTMDVTVRMYSGLEEVRTAAFNDLPVTDGVTYELVTKLDPEDGERHEIISGDETIPADEDSAIPDKEIVLGDATGEGTVDYMDAMMVLRHAVKLTTLSEEAQARCNVDGQGEIDYMDAMLILRKAVKLITEFPVEQK